MINKRLPAYYALAIYIKKLTQVTSNDTSCSGKKTIFHHMSASEEKLLCIQNLPKKYSKVSLIRVRYSSDGSLLMLACEKTVIATVFAHDATATMLVEQTNPLAISFFR